MHAKINVEMVEETQKIAQIVLHQGEESRVVLVEIENKKSRKRTPIKGEDGMVALPELLVTQQK